jgi:hypothetical protein
MKNGYEQIVENKQTRADTHLNGINLFPFSTAGQNRTKFCETTREKWNITTHDSGYNPFFWWKTTLFLPAFL